MAAILLNVSITSASAQTNATDQTLALAQAHHTEEVRDNCIQSRRRICGKILKISPDGLVVDSGYTNLAQTQFKRSWLIPGVAQAKRASNVIEENRPGAFCIGLVCVTDLPKTPGVKPKPFDYVNLEAFPEGQYDYESIGNIHRTVRKYSAKLLKAVQWSLNQTNGSARWLISRPIP
jgi:hypothetical protein